MCVYVCLCVCACVCVHVCVYSVCCCTVYDVLFQLSAYRQSFVTLRWRSLPPSVRNVYSAQSKGGWLCVCESVCVRDSVCVCVCALLTCVLSPHAALTCVLSPHAALTCVLSPHAALTCVLSPHAALTCVLSPQLHLHTWLCYFSVPLFLSGTLYLRGMKLLPAW